MIMEYLMVSTRPFLYLQHFQSDRGRESQTGRKGMGGVSICPMSKFITTNLQPA